MLVMLIKGKLMIQPILVVLLIIVLVIIVKSYNRPRLLATLFGAFLMLVAVYSLSAFGFKLLLFLSTNFVAHADLPACPILVNPQPC